jgi:microcompartment protein CcmK/EutM
MFLARVAGNVVSTIKNPSIDGKKILIIQPVNIELKNHGSKMLALDSIGAGAGEIVYCCRGREASFPWLPQEVPSDVTIIAIVDEVHDSRQTSAVSTQPVSETQAES